MSLTLNRRGWLLCLDARVGKSSVVDVVIGMFGEETCNASGSQLISFLSKVEFVVCNGRNQVVEPEGTRVRPTCTLRQKSTIDYTITDEASRQGSGVVHIGTRNNGCSDHCSVWVELDRPCKLTKSHRRILRSGV